MNRELSLVSCALALAGVASGEMITDPVGDTFGEQLDQIDLTGASAFFDADTLEICLTFSHLIDPGSDMSAFSVFGAIELDLDRNAATGTAAFQNSFAPPAPLLEGFGVDARVELFEENDGLAPVVDAVSGDDLFDAEVEFGDDWLKVRLSLSDLGDDGDVLVSAIVGTLTEPTDAFGRAFGSTFVPAPSSGALLLAAGLMARRRRG